MPMPMDPEGFISSPITEPVFEFGLNSPSPKNPIEDEGDDDFPKDMEDDAKEHLGKWRRVRRSEVVVFEVEFSSK